MLSRKRQERKMMMKTAKTLGIAGSVPAVFRHIAHVPILQRCTVFDERATLGIPHFLDRVHTILTNRAGMGNALGIWYNS